MAERGVSGGVVDGAAPKIGVFDATMLVMGGIVGAGIFSNPAVVARMVHSGVLMMIVWAIGGIIALSGAFVYAELAARHPARGGHYADSRRRSCPHAASMSGPRERRKWATIFRWRNSAANASAASSGVGS